MEAIHDQKVRELLLGNQAIARGAWEADAVHVQRAGNHEVVFVEGRRRVEAQVGIVGDHREA